MQEVTSPKRKSFSPYAIVTTALIGGGALAAVLAGVSPANAASLVENPDTQIMVFMIPLTLLVLAMLFEVTRFAARGVLPATPPAQRPTRRYWPAGQHEG